MPAHGRPRPHCTPATTIARGARDNADAGRYIRRMVSTSEPAAPTPAVPTQEAPAKKRGMTRGAKLGIAVATLLVLLGIVLKLVEPAPSEMSVNTTGTANLLDAQGNPIPNQDPPPAADSEWAPGFLKMGFSFFVCFALGYAARKFLKLGLVLFGVMFAFLYLMMHLGYVQVDFGAMGEDFERFRDNAFDQFDSIKSFITGSLPSAGLGALGLVLGFKQG